MIRFRATLPLLLAAALAACSDDGGGPTLPEDVIIPAQIQAQIDALFPAGNLRDSATDRVEDVLERADAGQAAAAQSVYLDFVAFGGSQAAAGTLLDPNGGAPPTIEDALATLTEDVAEEAGLSVPGIPAGVFSEDGAVGTLDALGGTIVTGNQHAGIQLFAGALAGKVLITIERIPETGDPEDHDGPLPTNLPQYPRFYRIETFPAVAELGENGGIVGLCVVDPPDPFAPDPEVAPRLRIAHPDPDDPQSIEILPLADASFLDCDGAAASLSPSSPGRLGGAISSFSPLAAVDPTGSAPTVTSVTPNPVLASAAGGAETPFTIEFADPDGDLAVLRIVEISDPNGAFNPGDVPLDDLAGETTGSFTLFASCAEAPPARCQSGTVTIDLVLIDAAGNMSAPFRVTITFQ